jgi:hypothetical protein
MISIWEKSRFSFEQIILPTLNLIRKINYYVENYNKMLSFDSFGS